MGIPVLNMDGYLLKQIKAETARATAADENLQTQVTALQTAVENLGGGLIGQEVPTLQNGYSLVNYDNGGDKFTYWASQLGAADGCVDVNLDGNLTVDSATYVRRVGNCNASIPLPFNTSFNNDKPYLAVLAVEQQITFGGSGITGTELETLFVNNYQVKTDLSGFSTFSNVSSTKFFSEGGRAAVSAGGYAFSPPVLVEKGAYFPWSIRFDARAYGAGITVDSFSFAGSYRNVGEYVAGKTALALICKFQQ